MTDTELNINLIELSAQMRILNLVKAAPERLDDIAQTVGELLAEETGIQIGLFS